MLEIQRVKKKKLSFTSFNFWHFADSGFLANDMCAFCMSIKEELQLIKGVFESYMVTEDRSPPKFGVCIVDTTAATFKFSTIVDDIDRTQI